MNQRRIAWLAVALLMVGYACEARTVQRTYVEDFEGELCDGTPCGWERTAGGADQARWVETIHPGEHGLQLEGNVTVRGPGSPDLIPGPPLRVEVSARCDPGSTLSIDLIVVDELGTRPLRVEPTTPTEWFEDSNVIGREGEIFNSRIGAVVITKRGTGVCEVGGIAIDEILFRDDLSC